MLSKNPNSSHPPAPCVVVIGNFDGVHIGHKTLLNAALKLAEQENLPVVALTFEPHPRQILQPHVPFKRLMSATEKETALLAYGVKSVHVQPFSLEFAQTTPLEFIQKLLVKTLNAKHVVVGENFRFGYKAAGDIDTLKTEKNFTTHAIPLKKDAAGVISSTRLREDTKN